MRKLQIILFNILISGMLSAGIYSQTLPTGFKIIPSVNLSKAVVYNKPHAVIPVHTNST